MSSKYGVLDIGRNFIKNGDAQLRKAIYLSKNLLEEADMTCLSEARKTALGARNQYTNKARFLISIKIFHLKGDWNSP